MLAAAALVAVAVFFGIGGVGERVQVIGSPATTSQDGSVAAFAASMRGTQPDGRLTVRRDTLEPTAELLYLFDYYLSALGERSLPQIVSAIGDDLRSRLSSSPAALAQAERLLGRYLEYRNALLSLERAESGAGANGRSSSALLQARLQQVRELRAQFFSVEEASAFFLLDDLRDADAIRRMEISENGRLSLAEKQAIYARLDSELPAPLREERDAPRRIQNVEQQVDQMRASGAGAQEVYQFRAQQFSADAAYRLQQLDREEQLWASRLQQYQAEARALLQLPDEGPLRIPETLPPAQQVALEALRSRHFNPREQRRLAAYDMRG